MTALDPREELAKRLGLDEVPPVRFDSAKDVLQRLAENDYLSDDAIASVCFLADRLAKPVLVEGPAGTGKTALARAVADAVGARLIRLQCYEGLDDSKALYEWNYRKQLLRIQAGRPEGEGTEDWERLEKHATNNKNKKKKKKKKNKNKNKTKKRNVLLGLCCECCLR